MGKIITDAIETNAGTDLVFTVGGAERMRIATNGKITTAGELSTGGKVTSLVGNQKSEFSQIKSIGNTNSLQVGTNEVNSLTIGQIGGEYSGIGYNVNFDGLANPPLLKFRGADTASLLKFHNGGFQFLGTPTTGTANGTTPITFYSLMTIDNTGLVTIGRAGGPTTSLSVMGGVKVSDGITAASVKIGTHTQAFEWDGQWPQCVMTHYDDHVTYQPNYQLTDALLQNAYAAPGRIAVLDTVITPRRASSKIRVSANITLEGHHDCVFRLYRKFQVSGVPVIKEIGAHDWTTMPATTIAIPYGGNRTQYYGHKVMPYDVDISSTTTILTIDFLDTPNTTQSIMYFIVAFSAHNTTPMVINRTYADRNSGTYNSYNYEYGTSQCILQEFFA